MRPGLSHLDEIRTRSPRRVANISVGIYMYIEVCGIKVSVWLNTLTVCCLLRYTPVVWLNTLTVCCLMRYTPAVVWLNTLTVCCLSRYTPVVWLNTLTVCCLLRYTPVVGLNTLTVYVCWDIHVYTPVVWLKTLNSLFVVCWDIPR